MPHSLRVVFAGTPAFAAVALKAIKSTGFPIPLVLTQPDRPAGRGMKLTASPVKQFALAHHLPVAQPTSLRLLHGDRPVPTETAMALDQLRATPHDVMVVAAYGLLLPQQVLERAPYGCLNIHASLLPRWRGAAPVHRAIEAGDRETGITLMQMDSGLDTGPMIAAQRVPIDPTDTTATLTDKLAALGAQMIVDALVTLERNSTLPAVPQRSEDACYAAKIAKHEAWLDWRRPASELARRVRAFDPFPGASALLDGVLLKCWAATASEAHPDSPFPGTIVDINPEHVAIACGTGTLQVTEWQKPGGRRLPTHEFITGFPFCCGQRFALPPQPSR